LFRGIIEFGNTSSFAGLTAAETPTEFSLAQNYPNPFNPRTTIEFQLKEQSDVKLVIFDVPGRETLTLVSRRLPSGAHRAVWDGMQHSRVKKILLIR
jgi:hypothetical protein